MKRKILFFLSVLFALAVFSTAYAENVITYTAVAEGNPVVISGQITNVPSNTQATILVSETGTVVEDEDILGVKGTRTLTPTNPLLMIFSDLHLVSREPSL